MALALSCAARLWLFAVRPLWHDELFTVWASRLDLRDLVRVLENDSGPPLFYLLEKPFVAAAEAWGLPDGAARLLPFVAAGLLFLAARSLPAPGRRLFLFAAAASPFFLFYAAESRAYSLVALLGLVLFRLCLRERFGAGTFAAVAVIGAALLWTHYLGLFLAGALLAGSILAKRWRPASALACGFALFLPWLPVLLRQPVAATRWIHDRPLFSDGEVLAALGGSMRVLPPFGRPLPGPLLWIAGGVGLLLLVFLLIRRSWNLERGLGLFAVLTSLGGILLVSFVRPVAVAGRTEMLVLPIWLWLASRESGDSAAIRFGLAAVAAVSLVSSVLLLAAPRARRPFAEVPGRLEASARAGDLVIATGNFYLPARLAHDRGRLGGQLLAYPGDLAEHPGWFRGTPPSPDDERELAGEIAAVGAGGGVFLLLDPPYWTPRMREILATRGQVPTPERLPYGLLVVSPAPPR